jgi:hypothetical protein
MHGNILDDFEDLSGWNAITSGQAQLHISQARGQRAQAMRLDFDFRGGGGRKIEHGGRSPEQAACCIFLITINDPC